ncbi:Kinetochore protein fta4 [Penicillium subrubescens]|uniref:Kinetochore protein fta4 n=1 Tax=Penicillium subrubescens TaxID=1316194 RepID=A0A1Q5SZC1_9EURO|nr:Kinetochore protein fta4 [Penicillium subrubescens]
MDSTRTISELKSAFIRGQVRILSESLEPPEDWKNYAVETEEGDLPEKVIADVLHKVNVEAKQHHRVVYSSQAIHHVAHQVASLYWSSVNQETQDRASFANGVEKTADLSRHIYQQLRERLVTLDEQRQQRQRRLDQLRHMQRLLGPFKDPQKDIQPNLVTKDGELVQELEKMRMLAARVGGRISQQKQRLSTQEGQEYLLPGSGPRIGALFDTES